MNDLSMKNRGELLRAFANHGYEETGDGRVLIPSMKIFVGALWDVEHRRGGDLLGRDMSPNIMPTEALNHIWSVILGGGTQVNPFYVGIFEANVTPGASLTHATLVSVLTECTAYDETTRPAYVEGAIAAGAVDNSASRAVFTMNATKTIYGAFLASSNVKSTTAAGTCLSAAKFSASRAVVDDDELAVKVALSATST
jgi:hypothetical protein